MERHGLILLVASLCALWAGTNAIDAQELADALRVLEEAGIELGTEQDQSGTTSGLADAKDTMPAARQMVLDSMLQDAENCDPNAKFRRVDGLCNNLDNLFWGAGMHHQTRLLPNAYMDGAGIPRIMSKKNEYLPSSRKVSLKCFPSTRRNTARGRMDKFTSMMSMQFGQYIDHDVVFTELAQGSDCCKNIEPTKCIHPDTFSGGPCFPIGIEAGDRYFNTSCMPFMRSFSVNVNGVQEQVTGATSFVDASTVYGSSKSRSDKLRTFVDGKLLVTDDNKLPNSDAFMCRKDLLHGDMKCPFAGDARVNVFAGLTLTHQLFVWEHNKIATNLKSLNWHWDDERIFQEARKIIIAFHQKITYVEYLPHVLGPAAMTFFDLHPGSGNYHYQPETNPSMLNEFAAAGFRFGHSQIDALLDIGTSKVPLSQTYFRPWLATANVTTVTNILGGICKGKAQKADKFFTLEVTDLLFKDKTGPGLSTDLAARNVQRGRDHGLPNYLDYLDLGVRKLARTQSSYGAFSLPDCLTDTTYRSAYDIDLFVGGMHEEHMAGALVGPTFAYIIGEQFRRLKFGDRFFYETQDSNIGFTTDQLAEINKQSLTHILCRNTEIDKLQPDIFGLKQRNQSTNADKPCSQYADIDLSPWTDLLPEP